jgi:hypothetical protein
MICETDSFLSGLFYDAFSISDCAASDGRMIDELGRIWKKAVMA